MEKKASGDGSEAAAAEELMGVDGVVVRVGSSERDGAELWTPEGPVWLWGQGGGLGLRLSPGLAVKVWASATARGWAASRVESTSPTLLSSLLSVGCGVVCGWDGVESAALGPLTSLREAGDGDLDMGTRVHVAAASGRIVVVHPETPACADGAERDLAHWSRNTTAFYSQLGGDTEMGGGTAELGAAGGGMEVTDAYMTYIRQSHGYLRSRTMGMIKFEASALCGSGGLRVGAGMAATAVIHPFTALDDIHQPTWIASRVVPLEPSRFPSDITAGTGRLILAKKTYGMLKNSQEEKIFIPGWAGVNNEAGEGWQVPELTATPIHYLAMPNPKYQYRGEPFALAVHPLRPDCGDANEVDMAHWLPCTAPAEAAPPVLAAPPLASLDAVDWAVVGAALKTATCLSIAEFSELLNSCPNLFHWSFFAHPDAPTPLAVPLPVLATEIHNLRRARLL